MGNIKLYRLQKRHNSTLQPTGTGTDTSVVLKGGSDIITPTFTMHHNTFPTYNYVKYNGRYYFVNKIVAVRDDLFDIECEVDVLATYKASIQAASAYVLYYSHTNNEISDKRLSIATTQTTQSDSGAFSEFGKGTCYVLSVVGQDTVGQYAIALSDLKAIVNQTFLDTLENQINSVALPATDSLVDYAQYIKDLLCQEALSFTYVGKIADCIRNCYALPIRYTAWGGSSETIYIGRASSGKSGYILASNERILHDSCTVPIPWQETDWRRNAPYHEIYLYIPCIGLTTISPSDVVGEANLHIDLTLDKLSGDTIINVGTTSKVLAQYTTNVAVNYPVGFANVDPSRAITSVAGAAGALSGAINPVIGAAVAGLGLTNIIQPQPQSIGSNGGGAFLGLVGYTGYKCYCFTIFHDTTVNPHNQSAIAGEPYNGVMSLNISGYVQTQGASVAEVVGDPVMVDYERNLINQMLDGGIYIE